MKAKMEKYRTKVFRFIVLFVKNEELSEDLTQDDMLKVWIRHQHIQSLHDIDNYILKMAKHHVLYHFKKLAREKKYQEEIWQRFQDRSISADHSLITREIEKELDAIVMTLPQRQQEVFTLNHQKGLTLDEIASTLDIAPRTARNHLNRAMKVIRSQMDPGSLMFWFWVSTLALSLV